MALCQDLHRGILRPDAGFDEERLMLGGCRAPPLDSWAYTVYVDNCIIFGCDKSAVEAAVRQGQAAFEKVGLPVHEVQLAELSADVLGWRVDWRSLTVRPLPDRLWRLHAALEFAASSPVLSPKDLQTLVAHCISWL